MPGEVERKEGKWKEERKGDLDPTRNLKQTSSGGKEYTCLALTDLQIWLNSIRWVSFRIAQLNPLKDKDKSKSNSLVQLHLVSLLVMVMVTVTASTISMLRGPALRPKKRGLYSCNALYVTSRIIKMRKGGDVGVQNRIVPWEKFNISLAQSGVCCAIKTKTEPNQSIGYCMATYAN